MNGVESSTNVASLYASAAFAPSPPTAVSESDWTRDDICSRKFTSAAKAMLSDALNASGFVNLMAGVGANFRMLVSDRPDGSVDMEDLKPGLAVELAGWVASKLEARPETLRTAQAHVDPRRAVSLLK